MSAQRHVEQSLFPEIKPDRPVGYIVPSVFNKEVVKAVAAAVEEAAIKTGVARRSRRG